MSIRNRLILLVGSVVGLASASLITFSGQANAAEGEFYLQVSPSPLVMTVKPGQTTSYDLKIRNAGTSPEKLIIQPRAFTMNDSNGEVVFDDNKKPAEIGDWVSFANPSFTVQPGEWYTQKVSFAIPQSAGFSYSFALVIKRQEAAQVTNQGRELKGSVAIFTLVNIDKPGATRKLELDGLSTDNGVYEYLPAKINLKLKNTGNTIVRPDGNVFIQRTSNDNEPISTLPANPSEGYILPGSTRTLSISWNDGFPGVKTNASGQTEQDWNFANLSKLRIGYYTAKVVAVYNDGQRDMPVVGEVGFWVIPWKILLGFFVVLLLIGAGVWSIVSKTIKASRRTKSALFRKK
jgi:hypothetical protein